MSSWGPLGISIGGAVIGNMILPGFGTALGFMGGSILGNMIFPQKSRVDMPELAKYPVQTAQKGTPIPFVAGTVRVMWSFFGGGALVPFVLVPASIIGGLYLSLDFLLDQAFDVLDAFSESFVNNQFEEMAGALEKHAFIGLRTGHPLIIIIFLVFLTPFLLYDTLAILIDPAFLIELAELILGFAFVALLSTIPAAFISAVILIFFLARHLREKYDEYLKA